MKFKNLSHEQLVRIIDFVKETHSYMDAEKCVESALYRVSEILGTELGSIMLLDEASKQLFIKKAKGFNGEIAKNTRVNVGDGIAGWVAMTGEPLLIRDLAKDRRFGKFKKKETKRYSTDSLLSAPLKIKDKVIGVVNVNNKRTKRIFGKKDVDIIMLLSDHIALAIQNAVAFEEAKRQAKLKLDFISNVSHELKNPLAIVREAIALMIDGVTGKAKKDQARILEIAITNIDRLRRLLDSLLDLAKLEAGKATIRRAYIDLKKLIEDSVEFIKIPAKKKSIKVKVKYSIKDSKIWADYDKITQVVSNLLSNAVKFTPGKGKIEIRVEQQEEKVLISVEDSGAGIKKDDLNKLFNRFERVGTSSKKAEGLGLGLAICKEIVDIHRGEIWAESRLHYGSCFNFLLPKDLRKDVRI